MYLTLLVLYHFFQLHKRLPSPGNLADLPEMHKLTKEKLQAEHLDATFLDDNFLLYVLVIVIFLPLLEILLAMPSQNYLLFVQ
jgi:hypothetical protein